MVTEDQLSLAIGKRGQNVRLAARLTGWDIDILTPAEYNKGLENMEQVLKSVEGVDDVLVDKIIAFGCVSVGDIDEIGPEPLVNELQLDAELAENIVEACGEEVIRQEEEKEAEAKRQAELAAAGITARPASDGTPAPAEPAAPEQTDAAPTALPDEPLPLGASAAQSDPSTPEAAGFDVAATSNTMEPPTSTGSPDVDPATLAPDPQVQPLTSSPESAPSTPEPPQPSESPRKEVP